MSQYHEYFLKDHLGNTRVRFADKNGDKAIQLSEDDPDNDELLHSSHYYPFGMEMEGPIFAQGSNWSSSGGTENRYTYNGKEAVGEFNVGWLDYGARYYDAGIGRFTSVDPLSDAAPDWTSYRYAFNNPLKYIDPDGMYEWRINSQTGEYERFGYKGGDEEQFIYWDNETKYSSSLKGNTIYVGAAALDRYSDGEFGYAVSTTDLWSNVPDEYVGEYTIYDLKEREEARQERGIKFEAIQKQESEGLARRDQIWNNWDYINSIEQRGGQANGLTMAFDLHMIDKMLHGAGVINLAATVQNGLARGGARIRSRISFSPSTTTVAKPMSWNQYQKFTKGKFNGPNSRRQAAVAYKKYKANFKNN